MKKILIIVRPSIISSFLLLLISIVFQLPAIAQQQTKKGRWFIKHNAGSLDYISNEYKFLDDGGVVVAQQKERGLRFFSSFSGPDYGDLSFYSTSYDQPDAPKMKNRGFRFFIEPVAGVFIRDNVLVGASVKINVNRNRFTTDSSDQRINTTSLGIGPFVRYYFRGTEKARFFAGLESRYAFTKDRVPNTRTVGADRYRSDNNTDETELFLEPHFGYAWFVGKRWSFELQAGYRYRNSKSENTVKATKNGTMRPGYPVLSETKQKSTAISFSAGVGFSI